MITNLLISDTLLYGIVGLSILLVIIIVIAALLPFKLWFRALVSGSYVSMTRMIGMKLRKVDIEMIVNAYICAKKAGLNLNINELETHYMAGGDVNKVVYALISAHSARIPLDCDTAKAIDLAGRDVLEAIQSSVTPKVIETPVIAAIAKDGIELRVSARITLRANIGRLIGGAGEETIIARVCQGIVTTVGMSEDHQKILENPDMISNTVLTKGLDGGTAFEILSLDIADIDVGANIGAKLKIDRADADKKIAQAQAEQRRAMAQAAEQEMIAKTQDMKAQVLLAESEVPRAMADAFRNGKLGIMDYYRMQNVVADTSMRNSLAGTEKKAISAPSDDNKSDDDKKKPSN